MNILIFIYLFPILVIFRALTSETLSTLMLIEKLKYCTTICHTESEYRKIQEAELGLNVISILVEADWCYGYIIVYKV